MTPAPGSRRNISKTIFSPFFTTKKDGNGLGLAVAWKIVKAHGGDIMAENRSGRRGALPRVAAGRSWIMSTGSIDMKYSVLVVDDDKLVNDFSPRRLPGPGTTAYRVSVGRGGAGAFQGQTFDIVLTDLKMKEIDGMTLLDQIKRINPETSGRDHDRLRDGGDGGQGDQAGRL